MGVGVLEASGERLGEGRRRAVEHTATVIQLHFMRRAIAIVIVLAAFACAHHRTPPAPEPVPVAPAPAVVPVPQPAAAIPLPRPTAVIPVSPPPPPPPVVTLTAANAAVANGRVDDAKAIYVALLAKREVARDDLVAIATGLYRIADYADAVVAFRRIGTFLRGEEDLRYYDAVSLYETGSYAEAKHELDCALPFIERTEDVERYRDKIARMSQRR